MYVHLFAVVKAALSMLSIPMQDGGFYSTPAQFRSYSAENIPESLIR